MKRQYLKRIFKPELCQVDPLAYWSLAGIERLCLGRGGRRAWRRDVVGRSGGGNS